MNTHTPGPWHLNKSIRGKLYVEANGPVLICDMQLEACVDSTRAITEADACLIAAAPDLLQSCRELVEGLGFAVQGELTAKLIERAKAAIAKAEGAQ